MLKNGYDKSHPYSAPNTTKNSEQNIHWPVGLWEIYARGTDLRKGIIK